MLQNLDTEKFAERKISRNKRLSIDDSMKAIDETYEQMDLHERMEKMKALSKQRERYKAKVVRPGRTNRMKSLVELSFTGGDISSPA